MSGQNVYTLSLVGDLKDPVGGARRRKLPVSEVSCM